MRFSCTDCVECVRTLIEQLTDYETDTIIQKSLREELGKDVTVLTIAHRLQSIMDADKIVSSWSVPKRIIHADDRRIPEDGSRRRPARGV